MVTDYVVYDGQDVIVAICQYRSDAINIAEDLTNSRVVVARHAPIACHSEHEIYNRRIQCDGCKAKLPLENGVHYGRNHHTFMTCTAPRYK